MCIKKIDVFEIVTMEIERNVSYSLKMSQQVIKIIASRSKLAGGKVQKKNFPSKSKFVVAGENVIPDLLFYPLI